MSFSCDHCEKIRSRHRAILAEFGTDEYPGLYAVKRPGGDPMTHALQAEDYGSLSVADLAACACECHDIARMVHGVRVA